MKNQQLTTLYHCSYSIKYHLVIVTKYRKKCISPVMLTRLGEICANLLETWEGRLLEFNGEADHLHLLMTVPPKVAPSALVNNLKTVTARLIRKEYKEHLADFYWKSIFWSRSYCLITCGGAPLAVIKQYIERQGKD